FLWSEAKSQTTKPPNPIAHPRVRTDGRDSPRGGAGGSRQGSTRTRAHGPRHTPLTPPSPSLVSLLWPSLVRLDRNPTHAPAASSTRLPTCRCWKPSSA
uniref:Uncharacterized protein n=1 Tax=Aegilops tauschii subsp. strangulata TaxID=200361 RepID=A0A453GH55_AEGTS